VLNGVMVYEVRANWDLGASAQGKAAYLVQIEGD